MLDEIKHIKRFEQDGVICLRNVLSEAEVAALQSSVQRQLEALGKSRTGYDLEAIARQIWSKNSDIDTGAADRFQFGGLKARIAEDPEASPLLEAALSVDEGSFFYDVAAWKQDLGVRSVAFDSALPEIVAELLGANSLNFWEDTTFVKAPNTRQKTAFHQELAYFQIEGDQCVIVWIPLDPASKQNGVVEYVRGSHLWGDTYAPNIFLTSTLKEDAVGTGMPRLPDIDNNREDYDIISFDVRPGDIIIHHVNTIHGAGGNMSHQWRRAVSFRYCGEQVRYYDRPGSIPQVGIEHELKDGDRLISSDYPMVWPKPWPGLKLAPLYPSTNAVAPTNAATERKREVA